MRSTDEELPVPDFEGAARTRAALRTGLRQAMNRGYVDPDIADALTLPQAGDWLTSHGFEAVSSLDELHGPSAGLVPVPDHLADRELTGHADLSRPWQRLQLYRRVLLSGTTEDQRRLLNRALLRELWPSRPGPAVLLKVWEERFPELRSPPPS